MHKLYRTQNKQSQYKRLRETLIILRSRLNLSMDEFAKRYDINPITIWRLERGEGNKVPTKLAEDLLVLATNMGIEFEQDRKELNLQK